jgi:uncharacterized protein YegJ (DUF2314 family)
MKSHLAIFFLFIITSCNNSKLNNTGESEIYQTTDTDSLMNEAIFKARDSFKEFEKAFLSNDTSNRNFCVKYPFEMDNNDGSEHIWLCNISFENDYFYGFVDNKPEFTIKIKEGQKIKIELYKISDWQFVKNDTIFGSFTTKVVRDQLSGKELEEFDLSLGGLILPK